MGTNEATASSDDREIRGRRGAGDRVRTGDVQLGRLTLYQLSYARGRPPGVTPAEMILVGSLSERKTAPVEGDGFEPSKA